MKNKNQVALYGVIALVLVAMGIIARLVEHPPNFVPLAAIAIVSAYYLSFRHSWIIPLGIMLVSDLFIGFYDPMIMISVYGCYLLIWGLGKWAKSSNSRVSLMPVTLAGSVMFFFVTNFAVWAFSPLYAKTASGLYLAYAMGMPFFKWTLFGDVLYTVTLVGIIETAFYFAYKGNKVKSELYSNLINH